MTKTQLLSRFPTAVACARFIGIAPEVLSRWPEELSTARQDRVRGAYVRHKRKVPQELRS